MYYLLILGRNPELSKQEIFSYLKKEGNKLIASSLVENGFLVEVAKPLDKKVVDFLGGAISVGEIIVSCKQKELIKKLEKETLYSGTKNNILFALWDFSNNHSYSQTLDYLKKRFRSEKLKASQKQFSNHFLSQNDREFSSLSSKIVDLEFFVFQNKDDVYFGRITQKCDYNSLEKRDMQKPVRREALSISPRLAKIMLNLSLAQRGQTIVDPFCGIGVILQEALIQKIKVIGIDSDREAISGAKKNFQWFRFPTRSYKIIKADSREIKIHPLKSMVSEPDFGSVLRKFPSMEDAKKTLEVFENLMIAVLNNLKNSVEKRFVFSAPFIETNRKQRFGCNFKKILGSTGLRLVEGFPIPEFRENQIVGRQIVVLEK